MEAFNELLEKLNIEKISTSHTEKLNQYVYNGGPPPNLGELLEFTQKAISSYEKLVVIAAMHKEYDICMKSWIEQLKLMKLTEGLILNNKEKFQISWQEEEGLKDVEDIAVTVEEDTVDINLDSDEVGPTIESDCESDQYR